MKLAKALKDDPLKVAEMLERTQTPGAISDEAKAKLSKQPTLTPKFLEAQAKKFGASKEQVEAAANHAAQQVGPPIMVEQREFSVDADIQAHFRQLYNEEVAKRQVCTWQIQEEFSDPKSKSPATSFVSKRCNTRLESLEQMLVHVSLHILFDTDARTARAHWNDIRELNFPTKEKSVRAPLGPDERRQWLMNPDLRARLRD